jgi:hypothetical protein
MSNIRRFGMKYVLTAVASVALMAVLLGGVVFAAFRYQAPLMQFVMDRQVAYVASLQDAVPGSAGARADSEVFRLQTRIDSLFANPSTSGVMVLVFEYANRIYRLEAEVEALKSRVRILESDR